MENQLQVDKMILRDYKNRQMNQADYSKAIDVVLDAWIIVRQTLAFVR